MRHDELQIPVNDLGFRQGATAVERLRTYGGDVFQLDAHLDRWQKTVDALGIAGLPLRAAIGVLLNELIGRNPDFVDAVGDFGITMLATPGTSGHDPTFCMHLNAIDDQLVQRRRQRGQPLVVTEVMQPAAKCWPRSIKVRCRLHYFLADQVAAEQQSDGLGVLADSDGSITETSIANLAIVRSGEVISPRRDQILGGVTQMVVQSLAAEAGIPWGEASITAADLAAAEEILLMGTDGGLWFARSVDDQLIGHGRSGEIYTQLLQRFVKLAG